MSGMKLAGLVVLEGLVLSSCANAVGGWGARSVLNMSTTFSGALATGAVSGLLTESVWLGSYALMKKHKVFGGRDDAAAEFSRELAAAPIAAIVSTLATTALVPNIPASLFDHQVTYLQGAAYGALSSMACPGLSLAYSYIKHDSKTAAYTLRDLILSVGVTALGGWGARSVLNISTTFSGAIATGAIAGLTTGFVSYGSYALMKEHVVFGDRDDAAAKNSRELAAAAIAVIVSTLATTALVPNIPASLFDHQVTYLQGIAYGALSSAACCTFCIGFPFLVKQAEKD